MKNIAKTKGKRITAALLCAVMCIMSLPLSAFAFTAEEGKTVDAYYGDRYFGSDGDYYYSPESHQYITFEENEHKAIVLALPDGFEWDDERTIRYTYNNYEFYAFLAERAKAAKALHDWATQLPPVA